MASEKRMMVPAVAEPQRYRGLYMIDFGDWTATGYTAAEVAMLLEHEAYRSCKVYKIHRAAPDGTMELRGVAHETFALESGMFFWRSDLGAARSDYDELIALAEQTSPPGRAFVHLARSEDAENKSRWVTAIVYPAELDEEFAAWLETVGYSGGDFVEGGVSAVTSYYEQKLPVKAQRQLWSAEATASRSREELLASVRRAVQR